jgi:hypothetical protein
MAIIPAEFDVTFCYRAFGLNLVSNVSIPGLPERSDRAVADLTISLNPGAASIEPSSYPDLWFESRYTTPWGEPLVRIFSSRTDPRDYWVSYQEGVNFLLRDGVRSLSVSWPADYFFEDAVTYLLGPVMAFISQMKGVTCLHGSAIAIEGGAVVLTGPQGAGKSTTAASFARAGFPIISDDLILLHEKDGAIVVEPSYPVLRLWPDSVTHLFGNEDALPRISPSWNKRGFNVIGRDAGFQQSAIPIRAIYFLEPRSGADDAPFLKPASGASAVVRMVGNSWGHYAAEPAILARQLGMLTRVSQVVPLAEVTAHTDPHRLPALLELILNDAARARERQSAPGLTS